MKPQRISHPRVSRSPLSHSNVANPVKVYWSTGCCTIFSHRKGAKDAKFYTNPLRSLRLGGKEPLCVFVYHIADPYTFFYLLEFRQSDKKPG